MSEHVPDLVEVQPADPCPCGSGTTFGECCLPRLETAERRAAQNARAPGSELPAMEDVPAKLEWRHGLAAVRAYTDSACVGAKCGRTVPAGGVSFIDRESLQVYCHDCGKCERYARKKAAERAFDAQTPRA